MKHADMSRAAVTASNALSLYISTSRCDDTVWAAREDAYA